MYYANGPVNGLCDIQDCVIDAWAINNDHAVTNSFPPKTFLTGLQFAVWAYPGDTPLTVDFSVGGSPFAGTPTTVNVSSVFQYSNQYGYDIDVVTVSGLAIHRGEGTSWLTLQNAVTAQGNPLYWDENNGPSQAQENTLGTIPSESFNIEGYVSDPQCFTDMPQDGFTVLHSFNPQRNEGSPNGVVSDRAGNIYGATDGVTTGYGEVYKLSPEGSGWTYDPLYVLPGGAQGSNPSALITGPEGRFYSAMTGGLQDCPGGYYCGLVFSLQPPPTACPSTMCAWQETPIYNFTSSTDVWGPIGNIAFDEDGNIFGASMHGGAYQNGAIYELTPSASGWTETILYSFTGGTDGGQPQEVLVGNDGNVYGIAGYPPVIFRLARSRDTWTETTIYSVDPAYSRPRNLLRDNNGNLFAIADQFNFNPGSIIFELTPSNGKWLFQRIAYTDSYSQSDIYTSMTFDSAGNLWGTGGGGTVCYGDNCGRRDLRVGRAFPQEGYVFGYVFKLDASLGWGETQPLYLPRVEFWSWGPLTMDAKGHLFGVTEGCGDYDNGTVWEYSTSQALAGSGRRR